MVVVIRGLTWFGEESQDPHKRGWQTTTAMHSELCAKVQAFGVAVVPDFVPQPVVEALRTDCRAMANAAGPGCSLVRDRGCVLEATREGCNAAMQATTPWQYRRHREDALGLACETSAFLFSDRLVGVARALLLMDEGAGGSAGDTGDRGSTASPTTTTTATTTTTSSPSTTCSSNTHGSTSVYLLNENFIVKPPRAAGSAFGWHQDSEGITDLMADNKYVSLWCALDDMTEDNGCLVVPAAGGRVAKDDLESAERVPLLVRSGSLVALAHDSWHCSLPNTSARARRAWMPQFSKLPATDGCMAVLCAAERGDPLRCAASDGDPDPGRMPQQRRSTTAAIASEAAASAEASAAPAVAQCRSAGPAAEAASAPIQPAVVASDDRRGAVMLQAVLDENRGQIQARTQRDRGGAPRSATACIGDATPPPVKRSKRGRRRLACVPV